MPNFLDQQPRYDSLFAYSSDDYRSWARGLKAAGYATAPDYAQRLISIIEDNQLYLFDEDNGAALYAAHRRAEQGITDDFADQSSVETPATHESAHRPERLPPYPNVHITDTASTSTTARTTSSRVTATPSRA